MKWFFELPWWAEIYLGGLCISVAICVAMSVYLFIKLQKLKMDSSKMDFPGFGVYSNPSVLTILFFVLIDFLMKLDSAAAWPLIFVRVSLIYLLLPESDMEAEQGV